MKKVKIEIELDVPNFVNYIAIDNDKPTVFGFEKKPELLDNGEIWDADGMIEDVSEQVSKTIYEVKEEKK